MHHPTLLPTSLQAETFGGVTYHLDGELVPVLTVEMAQGTSVYFEHHTLLWKNTSVEIGIKKMAGLFKRMISGMQIFMTEATGNGQIAFSRDGVGHIFPMHLKHGQELHVREHQFLAATGNIDYTFEMVKSVSSLLFGGMGFFIDKFFAPAGDGIVWLHGYGNVFEITLEPGEQIDVEPSAWLYKDPSVQLTTVLAKFTTGLFASTNITLNRFTGPGRLGLQSMTLPVFTPGDAGKATVNAASALGIGGAILGGLLGGNKNG